MKLKNNFSQEDRNIYLDNYECWICSQNSVDALHHTMGRGGPGSTVESSILNSSPVCNFKCHLQRHGFLMTKPQQMKLLHKTYSYLCRIGYNVTTHDKNFIEKYRNYYPDHVVRENSIKEEWKNNDM